MAQARTDPSRRPAERSPRLGAWLLWFAVLGGATAWSVHLVLAWGAVELACTDAGGSGDASILGLSVRGFAALATGVPLAVAVASLVFSSLFRAGQLAGKPDGDDPRLGRGRFMAQVGVWLNVFAVLMIAFGGLAVVWFAPCTT